jgi:competence protein ComEA
MPHRLFNHSSRTGSTIRRFLVSIATVVFTCLALANTAAAAVEVNSADVSQLETVKGIGPSLSSRIMTARKQGNFKDWSDLEMRVSGIGDKNAASLSRAGLTVAGKAKDGAPASAEMARASKSGSKKVASAGDTATASNPRK